MTMINKTEFINLFPFAKQNHIKGNRVLATPLEHQDSINLFVDGHIGRLLCEINYLYVNRDRNVTLIDQLINEKNNLTIALRNFSTTSPVADTYFNRVLQRLFMDAFFYEVQALKNEEPYIPFLEGIIKNELLIQQEIYHTTYRQLWLQILTALINGEFFMWSCGSCRGIATQLQYHTFRYKYNQSNNPE